MVSFGKKINYEERRREHKNFILAGLAIITAWSIAAWERLLSIVGVNKYVLVIFLFFSGVAFFLLINHYNKL